MTTDEAVALLVLRIAGGLVPANFEALGWTGFSIPSMRTKYENLTTGLGMGLLSGEWHFLVNLESDAFSAALPLVLLHARLFTWLPAYRVLMI